MEPLTPKDEPDESGLSRRDFLRATSALAAAPLFVQAGVAKAQTPEVEAQETEPSCPPAAPLTAAANAISARTLKKA
ncbi:twin-arginine translocation signal domain-containing protein [Cronobacter sakazakii]|uniref:twin-arginine translocation signal domain-containing protein n=1 Tax=Cronobacter sakazakii TaxID=28141 RepID=UPI0039B6F9E1